MPEPKFTQGTWEIDESDETATGEYTMPIHVNGVMQIAIVMGIEEFPCLDEDPEKVKSELLANARLIAAAPILYTELDLIITNMQTMSNLTDEQGVLDLAQMIADNAKIILAKARGESQ